MFHANKEKWKKTNNETNRNTKSRKNQNTRKKENYKYLGILEVDITKQAEMKGKVTDERENFSKSSSAVGISSNGWILGLFLF